MVSFNCDGCGDVVKKPKLDQHYHSRCRAPFTCLDCSTQFNSPNEWKPHTSCISEEKKYQKSVYKEPKGKGKKNEQQQSQQTTEPAVPAQASEPAAAPAPNAAAAPAKESASSRAEKTNARKKEKKRKREENAEATSEEAAADSASAPVEKKKKKDKSKKADNEPSGSEPTGKNGRKEKKKQKDTMEAETTAPVNGKPHADILATLASKAQAAGKGGKAFSEVLDECALALQLERSAVLERTLADYKLRVSKKGDLVLFGGKE